MIRLSSAARNLLATQLGLAPMFGYGHIQIFAGPMPATPDVEAGAAPIAYVSRGGLVPTAANATLAGLLFSSGPTVGSIIDTGDWTMTITGTGRAGWWRLVTAYELTAPSGYPLPRIDGTITEAFDGLNTLDFVPTGAAPVRLFALSIPFQTGA
jgi:hypothetical protein